MEAPIRSDEERFVSALGAAVARVWGELPQGIQEKLFEHAVAVGHRSERDESLREQLAKYLHERHERTRIAKSESCSTNSRTTPRES